MNAWQTNPKGRLRGGYFLPFFTFLRAIFFRPFRLSLAPTICPWVSEDGDVFDVSVFWSVRLSSGVWPVKKYCGPLKVFSLLLDKLHFFSFLLSVKKDVSYPWLFFGQPAIIRTLWHVPLVPVSTGFHCTFIYVSPSVCYATTFDVKHDWGSVGNLTGVRLTLRVHSMANSVKNAGAVTQVGRSAQAEEPMLERFCWSDWLKWLPPGYSRMRQTENNRGNRLRADNLFQAFR